MMARDPGWSQALGNAVLSQRPDVMDAVQRMRQKAMDPVLFVGAGITFGTGIFVGAFAPFGWAGPVLGWRTHEIVTDHRPWGRTWVNRDRYVHSYAVPVARPVGPRVERHAERRARR